MDQPQDHKKGHVNLNVHATTQGDRHPSTQYNIFLFSLLGSVVLAVSSFGYALLYVGHYSIAHVAYVAPCGCVNGGCYG